MPASSSDPPSRHSNGVKKDIGWILKEIERLDRAISEKADEKLMGSTDRNLESRISEINLKLKGFEGCQREKEFDAMQEAIVDGNKFFRNVIAVGVIAAVVAIGGWLWSLFGIVTHNEKIDIAVEKVARGLEKNTVKDEEFRKEVHDIQIENIEKVNGQISQSEYRLMSAMAQMSRGTVDAPSPEEYREYREKRILRAFENKNQPIQPAQVKKMVDEEMEALEEGPAPLPIN